VIFAIFRPSCKNYILVDLWEHQDHYVDSANADSGQQQQRFVDTKHNLAQWANKTTYFRMLSTEAAKQIPDNSLDFVFVDARHDYCGCLEDIKAYYPKLRPGGIMTGHDYITNQEVGPSQDWGLCGDGVTRDERAVVGAVDDFAKSIGVTVSITWFGNPVEEGRFFPSWMFQKPTVPECVANYVKDDRLLRKAMQKKCLSKSEKCQSHSDCCSLTCKLRKLKNHKPIGKCK
jgi:hypothetical protein